jgi:hypothetical protein
MDSSEGVVVTPVYDIECFVTTMTIRGLKEGAIITISVPGAPESLSILVAKHGKVVPFEPFKNSGLIRIGD